MAILTNHEDSNAEIYRKELIALSHENKMLKESIKILEAEKYNAYKRIAELTKLK
jgi:hypothetical protein